MLARLDFKRKNVPADLGAALTMANVPSLVTGLLTIRAILLLTRTKLSKYSVALVGDTFPISAALPTPALPDLQLVRALLMPVVAIGLLGLIQGAGISQTIPNPDGRYPDPSGDFRGQGIANLASGFF